MRTTRLNFQIFFAIFLLFLSVLNTAPAIAEQVVVYSARIEQLIKPMFDSFTQKTGIQVKYTTDNEGALMARLQAEGKNTPADMLITVDAGNLWAASQAGLLRPVESQILKFNIPEHLRDPDNEWFGLSIRARTIVYNTDKVDPAELSTYEDLADPKWKNRLCLRTSKKVYNQSLVAMMIAEHGEAETEKIVKGWVDNFVTAPLSDDTRALEFVAAGRCDVTIVNTYYLARLMQKDADLPLRVFWPNQKTEGVHVNVSGAGLTRHGKNPQAAEQLLEFLSSISAQKLFADVNMEYPVNVNILADPIVASWGSFIQNRINLVKAGELQATAVKLMDRVGYR